jgi:aspartate carbamoyltransferase regulatory subunit
MVMLISMGCNNQTIQNHEGENINSEKYEIISQTYNDKGITINYPQVSGMCDSQKQEQINEIIKKDALRPTKYFNDLNKVKINIQYNIKLQGRDFLSIVFSGISDPKGAAHPTSQFYTTNINLNTGEKLKLKDLISIDDSLISKIKKGKIITVSPEVTLDKLAYTDSKLLQAVNIADEEELDGASSYFTKDSLGINVCISHPIGDNAQFEINYKDIKANIRTDKEVWKDILK